LTDALNPNPDTFDLLAAIEGTSFPEDEVPFLFDAEAANAVANMKKKLDDLKLLARIDEYNELEAVYEKAVEALRAVTFTVTVRAVPREVKKAALLAADAKYAPELNPLTGVEKPNFEKLEYLNTLNWQAHIVRFTDPDGRVVDGPLGIETVQKILDKAPEASIAAVQRAIDDLETGAKAGYETLVAGIDFLPEPSPEAEHESTPQPSE
jgi:hypothetical protein